MANHPGRFRTLAPLLWLLVLAVSTLAQTALDQSALKKPQPNLAEKEKSETETSKVVEVDDVAAQRRAFAISLVTSLADDARKYRDQALRPHVLARAADTLWDADNETARTLFRRAWEAAEKGDAEELTLKTPEGVTPTEAAMVNALRRISGNDLRADVLGLAARRDRTLGEEFLNKLKEESNRQAADSRNDSGS